MPVAVWIVGVLAIYSQKSVINSRSFVQFPANNSVNVNPDTHLEIIFKDIPNIGDSGQIRVYDITDKRLVDILDMRIPPGPTQRNRAPKPPYI